MKKGRKGKQKNKVGGEWLVRPLVSPPKGTAGNDNSQARGLTSDLEVKCLQDELYKEEKLTSSLLTEFIDRGLERAAGRELNKLSRGQSVKGVRSQGCSSFSSNGIQFVGPDAINRVPPEDSISGQCSSFPNEGKACDVSERAQTAARGVDAESDQDRTISEIELSLKDSSEVESNNYQSLPEEEHKKRYLTSIVEQMKEITLALKEPELSESQIEMNDQEQQEEVLALEAIYGDDVLVFEREDGSPRVLKISISVEIPENIAIKVSLPPFSDSCEPTGSISRASLRDNAHVANMYTFKVQHLPPIVLACVLPKSYPCYMPPKFTILAYWLDSVCISKLCNGLDNIWSEDSGQVVLYKWADWLHRSSLSELGFNDEVLLDPYVMQTEIDWRAISGCSSPDVDIPRLMQYNEEKNNEVFHSSLHVCNICFSEYPGTEFVKLQCQHIFCWKCMETYSQVHVQDGTVNKLNCPDSKCGCSIPPGLLKRLLGDKAFERWESLLLQKTLDSMKDVVYCPRCDAACLEDEDYHAQCAKCFYSFCSLCRDRRHVGQTCLTPELRLHILQERQSSGQLGREQRKKEQELINELLSVKQILRDAKQCPTCKMAISKTEGCNKMTCYNCGQYFCYRCNNAIDGYDHFRGGNCILFEQEEIQNWEMAMNPRQLQAIEQLELWPHLGRPCPNCRQMNLKQGNNNHIFCWACQNHYCALCHKLVRRSSEHYGPRGCKQHTAD